VASLGNRRETQVRDPVVVRFGELAHEEAVLLAPDDLDRPREGIGGRNGLFDPINRVLPTRRFLPELKSA
jgi:hypothetical protein